MTSEPAVVMYGTLVCPYCRAARDFLEARKVAYRDIRVDETPSLRAEMRERGGGHTVPQIWIGEAHVGGYTDMLALDRQGRLDALLATGVNS
ncbi:MAG TPA: glutaredoxin 3 [Pseudomonadales bacterium]|nr:glutaredoxin 3 [Pseudomonadales bacterium]